MGIIEDTISVQHSIEFGTPQPTDSWKSNVKPVMKTTGQYLFDLKNFPLNDLPSGGMSSRISPSEMALCYFRADNYNPMDDRVNFKWFEGSPARGGTGKKISEFTSGDIPEDPSWTLYYSWEYSFIGHFCWEIHKPGWYSLKITTAWGYAWIEFEVR